MKIEKGYKVVSRTLKSAIVSACSGSHNTRYTVQYIENEWVQPHNSDMPLMVFRDRQAAIDFARMDVLDGKVFECEYVKSKKKWGWCFDEIKTVLKSKREKKKMVFKRALPTGTILADKVKLTRQVSYFGN